MSKTIKILAFPLEMVILGLINLYKFCISPLLPKQCRFLPTCSNYAIIAIKEHGLLRGGLLAIKRIIRCNPKSNFGVDPVPPNIKGDIKWLI